MKKSITSIAAAACIAAWASAVTAPATAAPGQRDVPDSLTQFEPDMARASACVGTTSGDMDFEQIAETTYISGPARVRTVFKLQRPGIHYETVAAQGSRREGAVLTGLFGRWENTITFTSNDWDDFLEKAVTTRTIECSAPLLPLTAGKTIDYSHVVSHLWLVTARLLRTHGYEMKQQVKLEVLGGPLSEAELSNRYPKLKLMGDGAQKWKAYPVRSTAVRQFTAYDESESTPKDETKICEALFFEGPNYYLCPDDYAKDKWAITLKQL